MKLATFFQGVFVLGIWVFQISLSDAEEPPAKVLQRFDCPEAKQAVAVGKTHFFVISNAEIGKYDKRTGQCEQRWRASDTLPLKHLNSGVVIDGKLYCAHSNYPESPEASSVEIFDTETLQHVGNHSLGIYEGSLTWVDWHNDAWWAVFAHYSKRVPGVPHAKPTAYTSLVKFDSRWRRLAGWTFPAQLIQHFEPNSCSGGGWGPDGRLYCTGHDSGELYQLELPRAGSVLLHRQTFAVEATGQGIAWDVDRPGVLYGIDRVKRQVIVSKLPLLHALEQSPQVFDNALPSGQR